MTKTPIARAKDLINEDNTLSPIGNAPAPLTEVVGEDHEFDLEIKNQIASDLKSLPEQIQELLSRLTYYQGELGMDLDESLLLLDVDPKWFMTLQNKYPVIDKLLKKMEIQLKKDLLKIVMKDTKARKDSKSAMDILSKKFPNEYGKNAGRAPTDDSNDPVRVAINFIQNTGDNQPLISPTSGQNEPDLGKKLKEKVLDVETVLE